MRDVHETALVSASAKLGSGVRIGPYAVVESDVIIGDGTSVAAHAVIKRYTRMGRNNRIFEHAVLGGEPQDYSFEDCVSYLEIGDGNLIREGVTIHRACKQGEVTRIGHQNFLMAQSHVAHDCVVGDRAVICNGTLLAGFVEVGDRAFISGAVGIHQFCRIGRLAMIGSNAKIDQDVLPFTVVSGVPGRSRGVNSVGLKRAGYASDDIRALKNAYRRLMAGDQGLDDRLTELESLGHQAVDYLVEFVRGCSRGFVHEKKT